MEWIRVKDKLPEENKLVLVDSKKHGVTIGMCWFDANNEFEAEDVRTESPFSWIVAFNMMRSSNEFGGHEWVELNGITHWMPLPICPEEYRK